MGSTFFGWLRSRLTAFVGRRLEAPQESGGAQEAPQATPPPSSASVAEALRSVPAALPSRFADLDAPPKAPALFAGRAFGVTDPHEREILARVDAVLDEGRFTVPALPDAQVRALELANSPSASAREIAEVIRRDAGVATEVISLVNSAAYQPASPIRDLQRAVVHVGTARVRGLLYGVAMRLTVFRRADAARARQLWTHSMGVAVAARAIARRSRQDPEEAFLAGLLHDVGKSVILGLVSDEEKGRGGKRLSDPVLWDLLEGAHTAVGARVAKTWGLTEGLSRAIEGHHLVSESSEPLVAAVGLADDVCRRHGIGTPPLPVKFTDHPAFAALGLGEIAAFELVDGLPAIVASEEAPRFASA